MIFRTGSVLIVGMCKEDVLYDIYYFLRSLLIVEFKHIAIGLNTNSNKDKKKKLRKRLITIDNSLTNNSVDVSNTDVSLSSAEKKDLIEVDDEDDEIEYL
jgi:hypothetical protein